MRDMLNLNKLLENIKVAEEIAADVQDDQSYNVLTQEVNEALFESMDTTEMNAVIENCKDIQPEIALDDDMFTLASKVNTALGLMESMDGMAATSEKVGQNSSMLVKGKMAVLKQPNTGENIKVEIVNVTPKVVVVKGPNGGTANLSHTKFYGMLQSLVEAEARTESADLVFPIDAENVEKKAESVTTEVEKKTEKEVSAADVKPEGTLEPLPSDLPPDVEKTTEQTVVEPKVETSKEFEHKTALSQEEFLKLTVKAEKDAKPSVIEKLPAQKIEKKLFENAERFTKFVSSYKNEKNAALIEAVVKAFTACLEKEKSKINSK